MPHSFDAVLVIAFGGPQGPDDIRPFLSNVLRGRRVAPARVEEVAHHYELFGGMSPLRDLTDRQAAALGSRLAGRGVRLPCTSGCETGTHICETRSRKCPATVRRAVGFIAAAHRSYSSCTQYRENVAEAGAAIRAEGLADVEITFVGDWHTHEGFINANAAQIRAALEKLPAELRDDAQIVFTAHSIPMSMAEQYLYERQVRESAEGVLFRLKAEATPKLPLATLKLPLATRELPVTPREFPVASGFSRKGGQARVVFQSRSGRPEDPWLGPDICDYLREARNEGVPAVVVSPIGFLCDHVEVLYDLDVEAAQVAREIGLPLARARAVNDHPAFIETMSDAVISVCERYAPGRPLPLLPTTR